MYLTVNFGREEEKAKDEAKDFLETYYGSRFPAIERFGFFGEEREFLKTLEEYSSAGAETILLRFATYHPLSMMKRFAKLLMHSFS